MCFEASVGSTGSKGDDRSKRDTHTLAGDRMNTGSMHTGEEDKPMHLSDKLAYACSYPGILSIPLSLQIVSANTIMLSVCVQLPIYLAYLWWVPTLAVPCRDVPL